MLNRRTFLASMACTPFAFAAETPALPVMELQTSSQALAQAAAHKLMSLASLHWICCSHSTAAIQPTPAAYS